MGSWCPKYVGPYALQQWNSELLYLSISYPMCFHSDLSGVASIFGHYAKLGDTPCLGIPVFSRVRKLAKRAN
jgi:hypothetical protein